MHDVPPSPPPSPSLTLGAKAYLGRVMQTPRGQVTIRVEACDALIGASGFVFWLVSYRPLADYRSRAFRLRVASGL